MRLSLPLCLRRILNSPYHPFRVLPKADPWPVRERLWRFTAWQYGQQRDQVRATYRKQNKLFHYMNMHRLDEEKLEHFWSTERVGIAAREHGLQYQHLRNMLDKAHILLDNRALAQLAIYEPRTFKSLVMLAKEMAVRDGRQIVSSPEQERVYTDSRLFGQPFPRSRLYPRGAAEDHKVKPRLLREDEY